MNTIIKLGMLFKEGSVPEFGSIELNPKNKSLVLLAADIPKLNSTLTKTACTPYLVNSNGFGFNTGDTAYIADWLTSETGSLYIYHGSTDHWYEFIPNE